MPAFAGYLCTHRNNLQDDDGFILYESRAICRYVAEKYGNQGTPNLLPTKDLRSRAMFEQAASIETSDFDMFASKAVFEMIFKPCVCSPVVASLTRSTPYLTG